jgi:hypothetical protein
MYDLNKAIAQQFLDLYLSTGKRAQALKLECTDELLKRINRSELNKAIRDRFNIASKWILILYDHCCEFEGPCIILATSSVIGIDGKINAECFTGRIE